MTLITGEYLTYVAVFSEMANVKWISNWNPIDMSNSGFHLVIYTLLFSSLKMENV